MKSSTFKLLLAFGLLVFSFSSLFSQNQDSSREKTKKFKVIHELPRFPGCEDLGGSSNERYSYAKNKMYKFIVNNLEYPDEAKKNQIEGICVVQFVVTEQGLIKDIELVKDLGYGCGQAAIAVVEKIMLMEERWEPAKGRYGPTDVVYTLPVKFKL